MQSAKYLESCKQSLSMYNQKRDKTYYIIMMRSLIVRNTTITYYNQNATIFASSTANVEFHQIQDAFLQRLSPGAHILDLGCGSGRDTKYFLSKGFQMDAADGSEELCKIASEYTGIPVKHMLFHEMDVHNMYDGIWACASILHVAKKDLPDIFARIHRALKDEGIFYTSFKYGTFEGSRGERYFTDFTEETFREFLGHIPGFQIEQCWQTADSRPDRSDEKWLNLILRKQSIR